MSTRHGKRERVGERHIDIFRDTAKNKYKEREIET